VGGVVGRRFENLLKRNGSILLSSLKIYLLSGVQQMGPRLLWSRRVMHFWLAPFTFSATCNQSINQL
jgi:hypothetical protein